MTIIFYIKKNKKHVDRLSLQDFIDLQPVVNPAENEKIIIADTELSADYNCDEEETEINYGSELADLLGAMCDDEFSPEQIRIIQDLVLEYVGIGQDHLKYADYLSHKIHIMNYYNPKKENRFHYLLKSIKNDIENEEE